MRTSNPLASTTVAFVRGGEAMASAQPREVVVVDVAASRIVELPVSDARAIVAFDRELWIATLDDHLLRYDVAGTQLAGSCKLPFSARAELAAAPCGPPAAVWSSTPHALLAFDRETFTRTELSDADAIIPITSKRLAFARGGKLALPAGQLVMLAPGSSVLGGAATADARFLVVLVSHLGTRQLVVVALGTGEIVRRFAVPDAVIRVATRRAYAIAQLDARMLCVLDLHAGREVGTFTLDADVHDFEVDPAGARLAVRDLDGRVELHTLAELLESRRLVAESSSTDDAATAVEPEPTPDRVAAPARARASTPVATPREPSPPRLTLEPRTPHALLARPWPAPIAVRAARARLEVELRSVSLWTLGAIAEAWDTRRLGYGNEGKHPFELEVGAILGLNRGFAQEYVAAARERIEAHEQSLGPCIDLRDADTPIGRLASELGLGPIAVDTMLVIAAASLRGEIARLYGILSNDPGRPLVDELLVQTVLAERHDRHDIATELDPRAPLVRLGIVHVGTKRARPFADLSVDQVVLDQLRAVAPDLGPATTLRSSTRSLDELEVPRAVLERALEALAIQTAVPARIAVRGRIGSGRRTVLASLAALAGRQLAVIDAVVLASSSEPFSVELVRALRRAHLSGLVPCLVNLGDVTLEDRAARDVANEPLRRHPGPVAIIGAPDEPMPFPAGHIAIDLPVLDETARRAVWLHALASSELAAVDADLLAARYRIGPGTIRRAVAAGSEATDADATAAIERFIRQTRDARLASSARRVERLASWSSIVLPPDILDSLRELVARVRYGRTVFDTWGMGHVMSTSRGLTALFQGPPGTGKTLVAGVIARELGLDLYQVDLSKVMSKWIGETERNLATIFDAAEDGQVVLLFDEADSLFAKRTEVRSSNDRYANLEVNYLLQRLDSFEGIAILTTNSGTSIDQAFKRRMSFRLSFPFPDEDTRAELWRAHLPADLPIAGPLALDVLARKYQISGGYIRNACLRAAFLAAQDDTPLHQRHLERAVTLEYAELGKLTDGGALH